MASSTVTGPTPLEPLIGAIMAGLIVPPTLATADDLATWTGNAAPSNSAAMLRSCTILVLTATKAACYDVDETGVATDPIVRTAMMEATCIQAAAWIELNINPLAGGIDLGGVRKSTKILSGSIEVAGAEQTAAAKAFAVAHLVPEAERRLAQQNLLSRYPGSR